MAIEKFRFVSPGVQTNEIDESIIPPELPAVGPVIIGNTAKGPSMQPITISSLAELERVFGPVSNGNVGSLDVWRTGAPTSPTLATYGARAFLQNSAPVTVIRLAGVPKTDQQTNAAGWKTDKVWHLFALSGSTGSLISNIYAKDSLSIDVGASISASLDADGTFVMNVDSVQKRVSFDSTKQNFIRNVLNTNPTRYSSLEYFLGESFENSTSAVPNFDKVLLVSSSVLCNFESDTGATSAETGMIVDDLVSGSNSYNELFKFVGLNNGNFLAKDIKISIENVRDSKNKSVTKYGTFDVVIRKLFEASSTTALERFSGVNLDPSSDNYIAKRIGDAYRYWDPINLRYVEEGSYSNRSAYVRVKMTTNNIPATALPHGFIVKGTPTINLTTLGVSGVASVIPNIPLFEDKISIGRARAKRFGLVSDSVSNADLVDITLFKNATRSDVPGTNGAYLFHTRHISSSLQEVQYVGDSIYNDYDILLGGVNVSGSILGFDIPLYDGSDAKDILQVDPFINDYLLSNGGDESQNPARRAIKQAIDTVAEAEYVDMNILTVPGVQNKDLTDYMLEVCKTRGDCLALIDLKGDYLYTHELTEGTDGRPTGIFTVIDELEKRGIDNSYGAAYFPAVFVPTEGIYMPASIAALGAIAGTEGREALWFAPAGFNRGGLNVTNSGIAVSRTALHLTSADRDSLYTANINPIATFPNEGVVIFGQKTLQVTPSALDRVNVRRLLNFIKKQISRAATRILFEPNVEATWNSFKSVVEPFLLAIKNGYGLDDARVELDSTTTTADLIDRNIMYCKIYLKPTRAIEYIAIDFIVTNSGAAFVEQ